MAAPNKDAEKQLAARESLKFVRSGNVVGLGTGSTAAYAIRFLADHVRDGLEIRGIPSSIRTAQLATSLGIPLATLDECPVIDVAIDGADEIGPGLELIKGHGGALLREKIVASAARQFVVIADSSKRVDALGETALPIEVIAFGAPLVIRKVRELGAKVTLRVDSSTKPFITDEGHHILDCYFSRIDNPHALARELDEITGIVDHGLFLDMASIALVADNLKVIELHK